MFNYNNNSNRSINQHNSEKTHTTLPEVQWVTFPPLPEAAPYPFSSAVRFVSATLKPLTEPTIAYPSGPLPNRLPRVNSLLSASRLTSRTSINTSSHLATHNSNGSLKRSRTTTASRIPNTVSRKRSKSDFGLNDRTRPCLGPKDVHTPAFLIRQKHRHIESPADKSNRKKNSHNSPYPQYMDSATRSTTSLKSSASVTSMTTLYPSRSRAYSQASTRSSRLKEEIYQSGDRPVRATYLGGVGVYLSHDHVNEESIQEEKDSSMLDKASNSKPKPNLTIDVGVSDDGPELFRRVGHWYNRLLISTLNSASSSVLSFLVSSPSASASSDELDAAQSQEGTSAEESGSSSIPAQPEVNCSCGKK